MRYWATLITALNPKTGKLTEFQGPNIPAIDWQDAEQYCEKNGLGYCEIVGELLEEIPENDFKPNFDDKTNFQNLN